MRDETLVTFKEHVRAAICKHAALPAKAVVAITNDVARAVGGAIDREVYDVISACDLIPEDEFGGSVV